MSKFNPPWWTNWMAQDASGCWFYFESRPTIIPCNVWISKTGKFKFAYRTSKAKNWRDQLYKIEWDEIAVYSKKQPTEVKP